MNTIFLLWTIFWLLRITIEDIRSFTIPNRFTLAILLAAPFLSAAPFGMRFLAAVLPFCLVPFLGMGDVKLYSALGFCLGPMPLLRIACGSLLAGGLYAAALLVLRKAKKKDRIAFGPFIAASAAAILILPYFASTDAMWAISRSMLAV